MIVLCEFNYLYVPLKEEEEAETRFADDELRPDRGGRRQARSPQRIDLHQQRVEQPDEQDCRKVSRPECGRAERVV